MDRNREDRGPRRRNDDDQANDVEERLVRINRVSKVHSGGRTFSFGSIVVVGDGKGKVGVGLGKAGEVPESIRKGGETAKKSMVAIPLDGGTIPHEVEASFGASTVLLKPASPGTGVIAGGAVRAVVEVCGIRDILTKSLGSNNPINVVRATMQALQSLESEGAVAQRRSRIKRTLRKPFDHASNPLANVNRPRSQAAPLVSAQPTGGRNARGGQGRGAGPGGPGRGGPGRGGNAGGPGRGGNAGGGPRGPRGGQS